MVAQPSLVEPDDPAWSVVADALQAEGDPRGLLISLERRALAEGDASQLAEILRLRRTYEEQLERALDHLGPGTWFDSSVGQWRFGYVVELSLDAVAVEGRPTGFDELFASEPLRHLSRLRVMAASEQLGPLLAALEAHQPPLLELDLGSRGGMEEMSCERLAKATPHLRELRLFNVRLERLDHPQLEVLHAWHGVEALGRGAGLPRLRTLSLRGLSDDGQPLRGAALPQLRELSLATEWGSMMSWSDVEERARTLRLLRALLDHSGFDVDQLDTIALAGLWALDAEERAGFLPRFAGVGVVHATRPWSIRRIKSNGHAGVEPVDMDANMAACEALAPNLHFCDHRRPRPPDTTPEHERERRLDKVYLRWPSCSGHWRETHVAKRELSGVRGRWGDLDEVQRETAIALWACWAKLGRDPTPLTMNTRALASLFEALSNLWRNEMIRDPLEAHVDCCELTVLSGE